MKSKKRKINEISGPVATSQVLKFVKPNAPLFLPSLPNTITLGSTKYYPIGMKNLGNTCYIGSAYVFLDYVWFLSFGKGLIPEGTHANPRFLYSAFNRIFDYDAPGDPHEILLDLLSKPEYSPLLDKITTSTISFFRCPTEESYINTVIEKEPLIVVYPPI